LERQGPQPFEHFIGRLCEEFSCVPTAAYREWLRCPAGFLEQIVEFRAYARAKARYDAATSSEAQKALIGDDMVQVVKQIDFELAREASASKP